MVKLARKVLQKYRQFIKWYRDIYCHTDKIDLGMRKELGLLKKLEYTVKGYTVENYREYQLDKKDYHDYLSQRERNRLENINGRFAEILGEKVMFERIWGSVINVPHIFGWVKNGNIWGLDGNQEERIDDILKEKGKIIVKPTRSGGGGAGVHLLEYKDERFYIDKLHLKKANFMEELRKLEEYIFVEYIEGHPYAKNVFPNSSNSIRIVSVMNWERNDVDIILSFHRFGTSKCEPVDNISSGGLFSIVDIETGNLSIAKCILEVEKNYVTHPDTGARIENLTIPNWKEVVEKIKRAHRASPYYEFLAWDIVMDLHGVPYALEINRGCDLYCQMIQPLRKDKLGEYMRKRGILDR